MKKTMLIDSEHPEEIRVAVLSDKKVEDFDFESQSKKPLRGNIYLARITRVEPSLQAAFVEYGGNRHGFLAFSEIHPDYYQVPVSDRETIRQAEALEAELAAELEKQTAEHEERKEEARQKAAASHEGTDSPASDAHGVSEDNDDAAYTVMHDDENTTDDAYYARNFDAENVTEDDGYTASAEPTTPSPAADTTSVGTEKESDNAWSSDTTTPETPLPQNLTPSQSDDETQQQALPLSAVTNTDTVKTHIISSDPYDASQEAGDANANILTTQDGATNKGDDDGDTIATEPTSDPAPTKTTTPSLTEQYRAARRARLQLVRNYRIQEVIKRRQILLVQVVKEERGNKGAALTTYLSLAGRYGVLMPNTARGGGISRKITNTSDRKRLRKAMAELDIPNNLGLIIRTAGAKRTKAEIKRDYDYLTRLWSNIRELTMKSIAPCLIYEEASLIKRAMRDLYDKDISQVLVAGDEGYREAKDFMKMLMPSHAKHIQPYKERIPLFLSQGVEKQLDEMYQPVVNLKSGGYLVIQQTEALISIDVNSGRATRERNIETTALKTNLEAAVEVARQCRLRDLAGLVVIDFIDMEENRNIRSVEKKLKDAMKVDRARIQIGRISPFGLLEMSRQRRRSGIVDGTTALCPTCRGAGNIRSLEMSALRILRSVEAEVLSHNVGEIDVTASAEVALFILNHKRNWLSRIEQSYGAQICVQTNRNFVGDVYETERRGVSSKPAEPAPQVVQADLSEDLVDSIKIDVESKPSDQNTQDENPDEEKKPRRRRRRRRRGNPADGTPVQGEDAPKNSETTVAPAPSDHSEETPPPAPEQGDTDSRRTPRKRSRNRSKASVEIAANVPEQQSTDAGRVAQNSQDNGTIPPFSDINVDTAAPTMNTRPAEGIGVAPIPPTTKKESPEQPRSIAVVVERDETHDQSAGSDAPPPAAEKLRKRTGWWQRALKG